MKTKLCTSFLFVFERILIDKHTKINGKQIKKQIDEFVGAQQLMQTNYMTKRHKFSFQENVAVREIPHGDFRKLACMSRSKTWFSVGKTTVHSGISYILKLIFQQTGWDQLPKWYMYIITSSGYTGKSNQSKSSLLQSRKWSITQIKFVTKSCDQSKSNVLQS